ncbi:GIY-YIG nuclease family protein [Candidatus Roizmanbacteria bacterium]|nr:GIY-YIG nuclease family protein [Candidatus Roizmanbacteria bacterium]
MFYTYIIYNKLRNKIYTGFTANIVKRLQRHNSIVPNKTTSFTSKNNGTWELIYFEKFSSRTKARKRERWLKSGIGREFVKENKNRWIHAQPQLVDPPKADF